MADTARARKLSERIQQIVARMLDTRIKDPRLGFVTVTDVRVTGDLQHATIFYTVLGTPEERESSAAALASAKGVIRSEVGKQTGIRLTPTLEFVPDAVPETAAGLEEALRAAAQRDAELARLAAGAKPAGDADPYRRPADADDAAAGDGEDPLAADAADDRADDGATADDTPTDGADEGDLADER
ncbi:30S ribosome-binding factor RbfA [Georgenia wangjunii]|uniref:30S ribosome-binding factor RbfA n=1 Tax=Georgenia wangjunii TaxID=3117730 RepID=UPI002F2616AC